MISKIFLPTFVYCERALFTLLWIFVCFVVRNVIKKTKQKTNKQKKKQQKNNCLKLEKIRIYLSIYLCNHQVPMRARSSLTLSLSLSLSHTHTHTIHPNPPSHLAGPLDCIMCSHRADVSKSLLVDQHSHIHVLKSMKERCLWVPPGVLRMSCSFYFIEL